MSERQQVMKEITAYFKKRGRRDTITRKCINSKWDLTTKQKDSIIYTLKQNNIISSCGRGLYELV